MDGVDPLNQPRPSFEDVDERNVNVNLGYADIVDYCLLKKSAFTKEQFKVIKSLGAHNQVTSGWVQSISRLHRPAVHKENANKECFSAKVYDSQALSGAPLEPWVIVTKDGAVLSAHCTCMAGLAEARTHVAALLFTIDTLVRIKSSTTVTQLPVYWKRQPFKEVAYQPANEIDFRSSRAKIQDLDAALAPNRCAKPSTAFVATSSVLQPSDDELQQFYAVISHKMSGVKPALLSVISGFESDYVIKTQDRTLPVLVHTLTANELKINDSNERTS